LYENITAGFYDICIIKYICMEKNFKIHPEASASSYYCPMLCEGDKTYDKPGTCPVCNMFLVPVGSKGPAKTEMKEQHGCCCHGGNGHKNKDAGNQQPQIGYYCPMYCEGDKTYDKPGTCPVCNMFLVAGLSDQLKKKLT
jgi:Cu2+-exporting ATPase